MTTVLVLVEATRPVGKSLFEYLLHTRTFELGTNGCRNDPRLLLSHLKVQKLGNRLQYQYSRARERLGSALCSGLRRRPFRQPHLTASNSVPWKERHEAVVRRTMERSQKPKQRYNRWSWGSPLHGSTSMHSGGECTRRLKPVLRVWLSFFCWTIRMHLVFGFGFFFP